MVLADKQTDAPIYYIMSDQPDCCGKCGARLDLVEVKVIDDERVFVNSCGECHCEVLVVEE
jgi:hypothetical protein